MVSNKRGIANNSIELGAAIIHVIDSPLKKIFGMYLCSLQANGFSARLRLGCFIWLKLEANNIGFLKSINLGKCIKKNTIPATWFQNARGANFFYPLS